MSRRDTRSAEATAARKLYKLARWKRLRISHLMENPQCAFCHGRGKFSAAEVVDHKKPHKGDAKLFFDRNNLQSLCKPCHDSDKQSMERGGGARMAFDENGFPIGLEEF